MSIPTYKHRGDFWKDARLSIGAAGIALLLFAYYAYTWRNAYNFLTAIDTCWTPFCDFAGYYYPMGESIFQTREPVTGFVYSPFIALLFAIFAPLGLHLALLLWGLFQGVFILLYLGLFRRLVPAGQPIQLLFVFLALSSFPLLHNLAWGQVGLMTTVSILGAVFFYERDGRALAAILLAFGISFKFFPLLFLLPFVVRRDVRFLLYVFAACGLFLVVIPAALLGVDGTTRFYVALFDSYRHFDWVLSNYNSQHFPHVIGRLVEAAGRGVYDDLARLAETAGRHAADHVLLLRWTGYGIAAANCGLLYLVQRARLPHATLWSFHILFLTIPFVLLTSWPSDLVYLSFAQGLLAWQLLEVRTIRPSRVAGLILLLLSILLSNFLVLNQIATYQGFGFYGAIFWSDMLLLAATYVRLLPAGLEQLRMVSGDLQRGNRRWIVTPG